MILGDNILYNLLHYGNEYIEKVSTKEQVARNSLSVIDVSINKQIILRHDFDISQDRKGLNSLKHSRRNDSTLIINAIESINDREIEIIELNRKRVVFSNGLNRIRIHCNRNKTDSGLEEKINTLLHTYDIKREVFSVVSRMELIVED